MKRMTAWGFVPLALLMGILSLAPQGQARAEVGFSIQLGGGGPPFIPRERCVAPYPPPGPGAVWIQPHYEWRYGRWVFVDGYYDYPPGPGAVWIVGRPHYEYWHDRDHHRWEGGHWDDGHHH